MYKLSFCGWSIPLGIYKFWWETQTLVLSPQNTFKCLSSELCVWSVFCCQEKAILMWGSYIAQVTSRMSFQQGSMLTGCWKASPSYLIHFSPPLCPSSFLFICPSLCSAAASEVSHTESSITGTSSRAVHLCVCVCACVCNIKSESDRGREVEKKSTHRG